MFNATSNLRSIQRAALGLCLIVLALENRAVHAAAGFTPAAPMSTARISHTTTMLNSGKVLVVGGTSNGSAPYLNSAEVYDPASNTWSAAASPFTARRGHTATLLNNGKVLVVGGSNGVTGNSGILNSAELYDPASNTWIAAASLSNARTSHTATLLPSGKVLIAAGTDYFGVLSSAEVYDSASNTWSAAGSLGVARYTHTETLLPSGKVLIAGGQDGTSVISSVNLYDPASNAWSVAASLTTARIIHSARLLPSGKVLVAGGTNTGGGAGALSSAEMYDSTSNTWSAAASLGVTRYLHTATLLPSGKVLVAGGFGNSVYLSSAEVYDPATNAWSATGSMSIRRSSHTATQLNNGKVLVVGGLGGPDGGSLVVVSSTELYDSAAITLSPSTLPNAQVGNAYNQTLSANGGTAPYSFAVTAGAFPAGLTLSSSGALSGTPTAGGTFNFTITATDSGTGSGSAAYTLTVTAPTIAVAPATLPSGQLNAAYSQTISASGGTAPYSFAVTTGALPNGMNLASGGLLSGTPTSGGTFNITVTATDSSTGTGPYTGFKGYTLTVAAPIVVAPATLPDAQVGATYSQTISASGGTGSFSFAVSAGALPAGLTLGSSDSLIGNPTAAGTFNITITATDSSSGTGSKSYALTVVAPAIVVSPLALPNAQVGAVYNQTINASGGTAPYSFAVTSGALPPSLSLAANGALNGTSTADGAFNFTITATDSSTGTDPFTASSAYTLTVTAPAITLTPATLPIAKLDKPYSQTITAIGGTTPYSYTLTSGALPAGLSLDPNGLISGTPTAVGSFNITITATDSSTGSGPFTSVKSYTLVTNLTFTPASLPNAQVGTPYSQTVTASGGGVTFSYAVTSGVLPAGLSLGSDGLISGTPTVGGTFNIEITATDTNSIYTGTQAYTLIVASLTATAASDASAPLSSSNQNVTLSATVTSSDGIVNGGAVTFEVAL